MKLKEFLQQFEGLDPEIEVFKWAGRHHYSIEKLDLNYDKVKVAYTLDNNSLTRGYSEYKESPYDKMIVIVP